MDKTKTKQPQHKNGGKAVQTVDESYISAALFAQKLASRSKSDCRTINNGIARQLRKGMAMLPGYEFDWNRRIVKKVVQAPI